MGRTECIDVGWIYDLDIARLPSLGFHMPTTLDYVVCSIDELLLMDSIPGGRVVTPMQSHVYRPTKPLDFLFCLQSEYECCCL